VKLFAIFALIAAVVMIGYVAQGVRTGQIRFKAWLDVRSKSPISFWSSVLIYLLIAFGLLFIAAKQTFFQTSIIH
jgi:hypothetical protein